MSSGLINYWPISNNQMFDIVGCSDMSQGQSTFFTADRKSTARAALSLNFGYTTVPSDVYFTNVFTFTAWVYQDAAGNFASILEFNNGPSNDAIILTSTGNVHYAPQLAMCNGPQTVLVMQLQNPLAMLQWSFIAFTSDGFNVVIYVNGQWTMQSNAQVMPRNITRMNNCFGKSSWPSDGFSKAVLDDLRLYDRCLTAAEILTLYNA